MEKITINNKEISIINNVELSNDIDFISEYLNDTSIYNEYRENVKCFRKLLKIKNNYNDIDYLTIIRDIYYNLCLHSGALKDTIYSMINYKSIVDVIIDNFKGSRNENKLNNLKNFFSKYNDIDNTNTNIVLDYLSNVYCKEYSCYLLSNDILDITTCSYKNTYRSCYNIDGGDYNNSVNYILSDNLHTSNIMWCVLYQLKIDNIDNINALDLSQENLYNIAINRKFITYNEDTKTMLLGSNYGNKEFNNSEFLLKTIHNVIFNNNNDIDYNNYLLDNTSNYVCYCDDDVKCYHDYKSNDCYIYRCDNNCIDIWRSDYVEFVEIDLPKCSNCGALLSNEDYRYWSNEDNCYYCEDCCFYDEIIEDYLGFENHTRYCVGHTIFSDVSLDSLVD